MEHKGAKGTGMVVISASAEMFLTAAEVTVRIRSMSDADKLRLIRTSNYFSFGGARSASDLRQEAIRRAIAGTRKCPSDVPVITFLNGTMRSIAWADRKAIGRAPKLTVIANSGSGEQSLLGGADLRLNAEDKIIQQNLLDEIRRRILELFEDDPKAQILAEGMMEEIEGVELQTLLEMDEKEFASKRCLVRRRIDRAFPKGWKP